MYQLRSIVCIVLAVLMIFSFAATQSIASDNKEPNDAVTTHEPKSRMSEVKKVSKKSGSGWLWGVLGLAVVAGGIAALVDGDSDSGGGDDSGTPTTTGDYDFSW